MRRISGLAAIRRAAERVAAASSAAHRPVLQPAAVYSTGNNNDNNFTFTKSHWMSSNDFRQRGASHAVAGMIFFSVAAASTAEVHAKEPLPPKLRPKDVVLYQYEACPFCNKVKAFLDYYDVPYKIVEVNPISKKEIKWSDYKKVPILMVDGEQMVDSSAIIDKLFKRFHPETSTDSASGEDEETKWRKRRNCMVESYNHLIARLCSTGWVDKALCHFEVDWMNVCNLAGDQGGDAICWTFAITWNIEALHYILTGERLKLSVQQVVDFSGALVDREKGGIISVAFNYVDQMGGLWLDEDYPFYGVDPYRIYVRKVVNMYMIRGIMDGYEVVCLIGNEQALIDLLNDHPVIVILRIPVGDLNFEKYKGGIYEPDPTANVWGEHSVLLVGYGVTNGEEVWKCLNSYSVGWGERGFFYIRRNVEDLMGTCGILRCVMYPYRLTMDE